MGLMKEAGIVAGRMTAKALKIHPDEKITRYAILDSVISHCQDRYLWEVVANEGDLSRLSLRNTSGERR